MRIVFLLSCVALFASVFLAAQPSTTPQKKSVKKAPASKRRTSTSAGHKTATPTTAAHRSTSAVASAKTHHASAKKSKAAPVRRSTQTQPTPGRYKEIQDALASRGYFSGPVDGNWGPESVDALKRFQRDQNLTDDGKIGSLSLIALGLGPKRAAAAEPSPENKVQQ